MTRLSILFDTAIARLEEQNERSYDEVNDVCRYRLGNLSCLFGHMISDANYDDSLEGFLAYNSRVAKAIEKQRELICWIILTAKKS